MYLRKIKGEEDMNNQRRIMLKQAGEQIEQLLDMLSNIRDMVDCVKEEEENAYENLPYSLQDSERGCAMQEAIDNLDSLLDSIDEATSNLEDAGSTIEDIRYA